MARRLRLLPDRGVVLVDGQPIADLGDQPLLFRLLTTIATRGPTLSRAALYEAVWDQRYRPPSSDTSLRVALTRLRKQVAPTVDIVTGPEGGRRLDGEWIVEGQPTPPALEGREALIAQVVERLRAGEVLRLTGLAGAGKTAVAQAAAARVGGVVTFVDVAGCASPADTWRRVAAALGAPTAAAAAAALRAGARTLVLDAADGAPDLDAVLHATRAGGRVGVCLTARTALGPGARIRLDPLAPEVVRARLRDGDPATLDALVAWTDGHAAAVDVIAAHVIALGAVAALALVSTTGLDVVDAAVDAAVDALPPEAAAAAHRLSGLVDGFDLPLAAIVTERDPAEVAADLTALEAVSLVRPPIDGRFRFPEATRARLAATAVPGAHQAGARAFLAAARGWAGPGRAGLDDRLRRERANLLGWLDGPLPADVRGPLALLAATLSVLDRAVPDLARHLTRALPDAPPVLRAELLTARAQARRLAGAHLDALDDLDLAEAAGTDPAGLARVLRLRSLLQADLARFDDAEASLRALLDLDGVPLAEQRRGQEALASLYCESGRYAAARPLLLALRAAFDEAADTVALHRTLLNLAECDRHTDRLDDAEARIDAADRLGVSQPLGRAHALAHRGWIARRRGDEAAARRWLDAAAEIADAAGMPAFSMRYRDVALR